MEQNETNTEAMDIMVTDEDKAILFQSKTALPTYNKCIISK